MNNEKLSLSIADAAAFSRNCTVAAQGCAAVIGAIAGALPADKADALEKLLGAGGRVGVELVFAEISGAPAITLIGVELEGARHRLVTVSMHQLAARH